MANTVTNFPQKFDPRKACFGAPLTGYGYPMPWRIAAEFIDPIGPGLALPKCGALESSVVADSLDPIIYQGTIQAGGRTLLASLTITNESEGIGIGGEPFKENLFTWFFTELATGNEGEGEGREIRNRGDQDVPSNRIHWTIEPWFDRVIGRCLGYCNDPEDRAECA